MVKYYLFSESFNCFSAKKLSFPSVKNISEKKCRHKIKQTSYGKENYNRFFFNFNI